jgi:serine protease Do
MSTPRGKLLAVLVVFAAYAHSSLGWASELADTLERVKPAVVAVGTVQRTRRPPTLFRGTGFVVGDGRYVITNAHVLPDSLDEANKEHLSVFSSRGRKAKVHAVQVLGADRVHDFALLRLRGPALPHWKSVTQ